MNQSKLDFILAIVICLILLFGFLILTKRFNCLKTFENFEVGVTTTAGSGTGESSSTTSAQDAQQYACHQVQGCIESDDGNLSLEDCESQCRFDFNGRQCVKLDNPESAEEGYYNDLTSCLNRYKCNNSAGQCILTPAKQSDSYADIESCSDNCKFKAINNNTCSMLSDEELDDLSITRFANKNICENRYHAINGECVPKAGAARAPGQSYDMKRRCEYEVAKANPLDDPNNTNKIEVTFDKTISNLSDFNLRVFKETLTKVAVGEGDIVTKDDIVGILVEDNKAIIVLTKFLNSETLQLLFDDLAKRLFQLSINITIFNVIEIKTQIYNSAQSTFEELVQIRQTAPVLAQDELHAFFKIDKIRDSTIKSTFFNSPSLNSAELNLNKSNKLQLLETIKEDSVKSSLISDFPNSIFLELINLGDKHYRTPATSSNFISTRTITNRFLDILEKKLYLDFDTIKTIYDNNNDVSYVIVGKHDKSGIFPYVSESYFLFYKNSQNKYKFRQIKVNSQLLKDLRIKEAHFSITSNTNIEDFKEDAYEIINLNVNESHYSGSNESLLFGNFGNTLNINMTLTLQKGSSVIDILPFEEERGTLSVESGCAFDPMGETKYDCRTLCNSDTESNKCSEADCHKLCNNCNNLNCKWNVTDYHRNSSLKPNAAIIKCFSGDRSVKLTWLRPFSSTPVDTYYIIVSNRLNRDLHTYVFKSTLDINEYVVTNIINGNVYDFQILCKNKFGVSRPSNIESVIPDARNQLESKSELKLSDFEDSIESYYKSVAEEQADPNELNYENIGHRISMIEREIVINDLKEALADKLIQKMDLSEYNINIH